MEKENTENEIEVGYNYILKANRKLGNGAYGTIYLGVNTLNNEEVAIKLEKSKSSSPQLKYEAKLYKTLAGEGNIVIQ